MSELGRAADAASADRPTVALLVTCLVDLIRPSIGFAAAALLERAGCRVAVPAAQTCCGQPAYNSGARREARAVARRTIAAFEAYDTVVAPSGSCAGMVSHHYPALLADDPDWAPRAQTLAARTHELTSFLVDVRSLDDLGGVRLDAVATYHDSCSGLRELGIKAQPRRLLGLVDGLDLAELPGAEVCCGFGGTFCVKYPDISNKMLADKAGEIAETGADLLLAGDLGCLMNMAGKLTRTGSPVAVRHIAEVLAGDTRTPPIARGPDDGP